MLVCTDCDGAVSSPLVIRMRPLGLLYSCRLFAIALASSCALAWGTARDDLGYTTLSAELGGGVPNGAGVKVTQVEAFEGAVNLNNYAANPADAQFAGKTISLMSGLQNTYSSHATAVAYNFYGATSSIAPGITTIDAYNANSWLNSGGFLHIQNSSFSPNTSTNGSRVINHSWVGGYQLSTNVNIDVLYRSDWLTQQDDVIQVAGLPNSNTTGGLANTYPSQGYNVIAVGLSSGTGFYSGTTALAGSVYTAGRSKPDLVAPSYATSYTTPMVSAAAADLVQVAHAGALTLSNGSITPDPTRNVYGTIYYGETSEVIRAALMAGAARRVFNSADGSSITTWRSATGNQTTNGLDTRYGAGQVNVRNSYYIVSTSQMKSQEDGGSGVGATGWDYDPHFGGASGSNSTGSYDFSAGWTGQQFSASLVWNLDVNIANVKSQSYATAGTLRDLNLTLINVTDNVTVATSASTTENTENIFAALVGGKQYRLQVTKNGAAFDYDYGLAWTGQSAIGWAGTNGSNWNTATTNWYRATNAVNAVYTAGEHVVFSDAGAASPTVNLTTSVTPGSIYFNNNSVNYTLTTANGSAITGVTGIIKEGSGMATLSMANTYTGGTTINAGILAQGANSAIPTNSNVLINSGGTLNLAGYAANLATVTLNAGGTLSLGSSIATIAKLTGTGTGAVDLGSGTLTLSNSTEDYAVFAAFSGSGSILKTGTKTFSLNAGSTFGGTLTVSQGTVYANAVNALGSTSGGTTVTSGATLGLFGALTYSAAEPVTLNGTGVGGAGVLVAAGGPYTFGALVTAASDSLLTVNSGVSLTLSGSLSAANGVTLTKGGAGTLTVSGSLSFGDSSSLVLNNSSGSTVNLNPAAGASITVGNAANLSVATGTTLNIDASGKDPLTDSSITTRHVNITNAGTLNITGATAKAGTITGAGNVSVAANKSLSAASLAASTLTINGSSGNTAAKVTIQASGTNAAGLDSAVSKVTTLTIPDNGASLTTAPGTGYTGSLRTYYGSLDLQNNDLIITTTGTTTYPGSGTTWYNYVADLIRSGEGNPLDPNWTGRGLTTTYNTANPAMAGKAGLGMIINYANPNNPGDLTPLYSSFDGVALTGGEIIVKYTWYGDLNLDGIVNNADFSLYSNGQSGTTQSAAGGLPGWYYGDVNYDGRVNSYDYALLTSGNTGGSMTNHLPEPSTWLLLSLGSVGLWVRRRSAKRST